ncbi:MBL fold metallo-hydrolase [Clostridium lundense]|uniref:MBL fold metallo-hydrolase n=1 Tax=Clostridium lundense TaxID=319475 RepID=UPI00048792DC|nr:MBL fold metallo-hydrolase [Clostridium lundense]
MQLKQLSERIYYLPAESETDRPVLGYIKGNTYSLMIDAGNSSVHVEKFKNAVINMELTLPQFTAITHWHWDHTFGMHFVPGKTIVGHLTNLKLKEVSQWDWSDKAMLQRLESGEDIEFCDKCIRLEYPDRNQIKVVSADIEFNDELTLDLGGIHCVMKNIEGTHSEDSVIMYIPEEKVLFVGDADCEDYYNNNGKYDKKKLDNLIKTLEEIDFDIYVLGHDEPQKKEEVIDYLKTELLNLK